MKIAKFISLLLGSNSIPWTLADGTVTFMACNASSCLPADEVSFSIPVK